MEKKELWFSKKVPDLGFYGSYNLTEPHVTSLAFYTLQNEVRQNIAGLERLGYQPNDVIKLKNDDERKEFCFTAINFNGQKFSELRHFRNVLAKSTSQEFWEEIADNEYVSLRVFISELANSIKKDKRSFDSFIRQHIELKMRSKIDKTNMLNFKEQMDNVCNIYIGVTKMSNVWTDMTEDEKLVYVARRYLQTGDLSFSRENAKRYFLNEQTLKYVKSQDKKEDDFFQQ
jgi:hypothetical protein